MYLVNQYTLKCRSTPANVTPVLTLLLAHIFSSWLKPNKQILLTLDLLVGKRQTQPTSCLCLKSMSDLADGIFHWRLHSWWKIIGQPVTLAHFIIKFTQITHRWCIFYTINMNSWEDVSDWTWTLTGCISVKAVIGVMFVWVCANVILYKIGQPKS